MTSTANASARAVSSSPSPLWAVAGNLSRLVERAWKSYWDYQARRATAWLLYTLDDRTLSDIGFQRSEIQSAVFGSPDRVRPYHVDWMWATRRAAEGEAR